MGKVCSVIGCRPGQECMRCENIKNRNCSGCGHSTGEGCGCPSWAMSKIPELYPENLDSLKHIMARLNLFGRIEGVFEVEVHVRIDNIDTWIVIGYGESGNPCLLRFVPK